MPSRVGDPSVWFEPDTMLRHQPFHGGAGLRNVKPEEGQRLYVRVVPERFHEGIPASGTIHNWSAQHGDSGLHPLGPLTNGDGGRNGDGVLRYALVKENNPTETWTAAQWFHETGELWTFDTERLRDGKLFMSSLVT